MATGKYKAVHAAIALTVAGITLLLTACDDSTTSSESVTTNIPADREYQIISTISLNDGFETRKVLQARLLLDYQLQDAGGKAVNLTTPLTHNARFLSNLTCCKLAIMACRSR